MQIVVLKVLVESELEQVQFLLFKMSNQILLFFEESGKFFSLSFPPFPHS